MCISKLQSARQPAEYSSYSKTRTRTATEKNKRPMKVEEVATEDTVSKNEGIENEEYRKYLEIKFNSIASKDT